MSLALTWATSCCSGKFRAVDSIESRIAVSAKPNRDLLGQHWSASARSGPWVRSAEGFPPPPPSSPCPLILPSPPLSPPPPPLPVLRSTLCARGWPSATPDDGPPRRGGAGGRCVSPLSPLRRGVSMVLCGSARLLSQPTCSTSPPVLLLAFAAGCVG